MSKSLGFLLAVAASETMSPKGKIKIRHFIYSNI